MATVTNTDLYTVFRGRVNNLQQKFFSDAAQAVPIVPQNTTFPSYSIVDPDGTSVQAGTGILIEPGVYRIQFTPSTTDQLSTPDKRWRIEWTMVDTIGQQFSFTQQFDVVDEVIKVDEGHAQSFLALTGRDFTINFKWPTLPFALRLDVERVGGSALITDQSLDKKDLGVLDAVDGQKVFCFTIPAKNDAPNPKTNLVANATYMAVWELKETEGSSPEYFTQRIDVININRMALFPSLRMLIDKFQMRADRIQSFEDSEINEYLVRGKDIINSVHPFTTWDLGTNSVIFNMTSHLMIAAMWYGLSAQHMLETYLQFDFQGSQTQITLDRTANLESAIQRAYDIWTQQVLAAKQGLVRRTQGVGTVSTRPTTRYGFYDRIYKFDSTTGFDSGGNLPGLLEGMGLLL